MPARIEKQMKIPVKVTKTQPIQFVWLHMTNRELVEECHGTSNIIDQVRRQLSLGVSLDEQAKSIAECQTPVPKKT